jgi:hypothetical protein
MMELRTKVLGARDLRVLFAVAPNIYNKVLLIWLIREKSTFVGSKGRPGVFSRSLTKKKISGSNENWNYRIGNFFKGYVDQRGGSLSLTMGANLKEHSGGMVESIAKMEEGYKQTSSKNMLMPIAGNMPFQRPRKLMLKEFQDMLANHRIIVLRKNGHISFMDNVTYKVLFVSTRAINVPKQFGFISAWESRLAAITNRGQLAVDKETDKIARGVYSV